MPSEKKRRAYIYCLVNMLTNEKYINSTFQPLYKHQYQRKRAYMRWLQGKNHNTNEHKLFQNVYKYGWDVFRVELVEEVEVENKQQLYAKEGEYIRKLDTYKNGLNGRI